jgi:3-deoxy-D-arabino-heptulosonate 7-phosphate (DAHP) synthase
MLELEGFGSGCLPGGGTDGLIIQAHDDSEHALTGSAQFITPPQKKTSKR